MKLSLIEAKVCRDTSGGGRLDPLPGGPPQVGGPPY